MPGTNPTTFAVFYWSSNDGDWHFDAEFPTIKEARNSVEGKEHKNYEIFSMSLVEAKYPVIE